MGAGVVNTMKKEKTKTLKNLLFQVIGIFVCILIAIYFLFGWYEMFEFSFSDSWIGNILNSEKMKWPTILAIVIGIIPGVLLFFFLLYMIISEMWKHTLNLLSDDNDIRNEAWRKTKNSIIGLRNIIWNLVKVFCFLVGVVLIVQWIDKLI